MIADMFWIVVGAIVAVVLVAAGISDLRRKRRTGSVASINQHEVSEATRAARGRARAARRRIRF